MKVPIQSAARTELPQAPPPEEYVSFGVVGHPEPTLAYARLENGEALVEVTLRPSGEQVIARLSTEAGDQSGFYMPLSYGARVIVVFPSPDQPVIIGRCPDGAWPFPESVAGVPTVSPAGGLPEFAFLKTGDGQILCIETGADGDVLIHSGGSVQVKAAPGDELLLTGRVRIGQDFATAPTGDMVGPDGETLPGTSAAYLSPQPSSNTSDGTLPLVTAEGGVPPAEGIMRLKDTSVSHIGNSPEFWAWITNLAIQWDILVTAWNAAVLGGIPLAPTGNLAFATLPAGAFAFGPTPSVLTSYGASCSENTCSDG